MPFNEKLHDAERGILAPPSTSTPAEKFLLFRDILFVCILVLHLGSAISAIPALVTHTAAPNTHGYLAIVIITGIVAPILCVLGYRSHLRISKITSAMWFEVGWVTVLMVIDFIVAVSYSTVRNATKAMVGLTFAQMIFTMIYAAGLGAMVLLQHRRFPEVNIWRSSVHTVHWLRSSDKIDPMSPPPPGPFFVSAGGGHPKQFLAPWNRNSQLNLKHDDDKSKYSISPMMPTVHDGDAHPFWQERVQRQQTVEDNMAYVVERYGLSIDVPRPKPQVKAKHGRRPSIRDLDISRPIPVVTTVRRANTLASAQFDREVPARRYQHQRSGSMNTHHQPMNAHHQRSGSLNTIERGRPLRGAPPPALRLRSPSPISPISSIVPGSRSTTPKPTDARASKTINPMSSSPTATSPVKAVSPDTAARNQESQGFGGRTLVGASRPKASGTRADLDISKPLPSPPPMSTDESLLSSGGLSTQSGTHQFVMSIAQRVKVSATKMKPMIISTPKQGQFFGDLDLDDDDEKKDDPYWI